MPLLLLSAKNMDSQIKQQVAVFGGGCFWCTEAVFSRLRGVSAVYPGYAGGQTPDPTYEQVSRGSTGHAEVIKIDYDPAKIKFSDLLSVFFATHDPTTLNQQGNDIGTQYRSVVFYTAPEQKIAAEEFIKELQLKNTKTIVTTVEPLNKFYLAEDYHRNYYATHQNQAYCRLVIDPKISKLTEKFSNLLKL
jgi:peptide-methionine (S)-S-oxide reductase